MHSLKGAPSLLPAPKTQLATSPTVSASPQSVMSVLRAPPPAIPESSSKKKAKKNSKYKEKASSAAVSGKKASRFSLSKEREGSAPSVSHSTLDYADDFEASEALGSDENATSVEQVPNKQASSELSSATSYSEVFEEPESEVPESEQRNLVVGQIVKSEEHEQEQFSAGENSLKRSNEPYRLEQKPQQEHAMLDSVKSQPVEHPQEGLVVTRALPMEVQLSCQDREQMLTGPDGRGLRDASETEPQRGPKHELTPADQVVRSEDSVRHLFQRLAQDVREVFHELNISIIAAEKERLLKDERYRRERDMRFRQEEQQQAERLLREIKEREERESKFWTRAEEREQEFRAFIEERSRRDQEEREARLKRDLQDNAARARKDQEWRSHLETLERERRAQATADAHERDNLFIQSQIENIKSQYAAQLEDLRRQNERDRARHEQLHRAELDMAQKRYDAASETLLDQHAKQLALAEAHFGKVDKLERLLESVQNEIAASKKLNETLTEERLNTLKDREREVVEQSALLGTMLDDFKDAKQQIEKERTRIAGLYAKFELLLENFTRNAEQDRRQLQEAQNRFETLRQQTDKDRRLMLSEVFHERKMLEQQTEEFFSRRMEAMNELQAERLAISRERTEAAVLRERQNRDETDLLKSLRSREEEYALKLQSIEAERLSINERKAELRQAKENMAAEQDRIAKERRQFEDEKKDLLDRFEVVRRRAHEAATIQEKMQLALVQERAASQFGMQPDPPKPPQLVSGSPFCSDPAMVAATMTNFQIDLAHQRAMLDKIGAR